MSTRSGKGGVHPVVLMVDTAPTNGTIDIKGQTSYIEVEINLNNISTFLMIS